MARHDDYVRVRRGKDVQLLNRPLHGTGVIHDQVSETRGWAAFAYRAAQPATIGGEEDAASLCMSQQTHLPASMTGQSNQYQRAITEKIMRRARSRKQ